MKKLLLFAAVAATSVAASAATFGEYFALTYNGQALENGQTLIVDTYEDIYAEFGIPGMSNYEAKASILATNVYDEAMDIAFVMACVDNKTEQFQLCYEYEDAPGNCLSPKNGVITSNNLKAIDCESYLQMDIHENDIQDLSTPTTFKLDLSVMEGGEKIEGTDATVFIQFTHKVDVTSAVDGLEAESGAEEYFNLQGIRVAQPERGNIYIVRSGSKVSKRLF